MHQTRCLGLMATLLRPLVLQYRDHAFAAPDGVWPPLDALRAVAEANGIREEPEQTGAWSLSAAVFSPRFVCHMLHCYCCIVALPASV